MAGIYCADIYCDDCIEDIKRRVMTNLLRQDGKAIMEGFDPDEFEEEFGFDDETNYDSDEYPKHCGDDEESDCPQHCGSGAECLNYSETSDGEKYGYFFENTLTDEGNEYVKNMVNENLRNGRMDSPAVELWKPCYDYIDYHEQCACGTYAALDDNDECSDCATTHVDERA